ncbi:hypothetical protein [Halanaerobium congolense]|uniref:Uncharacterized protein n=1 Tax=Halanaerobium congolense TaxID=54121 RepID=A0A4R7DZU4_9FIRM|nr:hypothetical protein [Halanaerobium congolense]TDS28033.1 hypothetical protein BY453_12311 [Halanaerobium congolense]
MYFEWSYPIIDYFKTLKSNEKNTEIILPIIMSLMISIIYFYFNLSNTALSHLRNILPATISILIGFSMTSLTIIVTSNNDSIKTLKDEYTDNRKIVSSVITLYQWLIIMYIHAIISEIFLLIFIFFSAFLLQIGKIPYLADVLLFIQISLLLHIFLVLLRNVANMYFIFYKKEDGCR